MDGAMSIAASGMMAAGMNLFASASNIANMQSTGPVPSTSPLAPVAQAPGSVYQPLAVSQTPLADGGVSAGLQPALPSYTLASDPGAPFANMQGMVAMPDVNPAREIVNRMDALNAYKANIQTFKVADEMFKALLNITA